MTIGIIEIGAALAVNPHRLTPVKVFNLEEQDYQMVAHLAEAGRCYFNAITSAIELGASAVVYGAVSIEGGALVTEHCWLRVDDTDYDTTYQSLGAVDDVDYYQLISIPIGDYLSAAERLGIPKHVISFHDLRMSPHYREYFAKNSRNLKEAS